VKTVFSCILVPISGSTGSSYHDLKEQRLALVFEQIFPEKSLLLTPSKKETENEGNERLCERVLFLVK
jgi:hypothetical protein